ncbi:MAG TPA: OmpA family protein [Sandaracinaceae bacterium LLY-WYZ-13_1]|nr:OmpA family protein [Sandaracinaceae bacterium LLY-WYZ-13_1]
MGGPRIGGARRPLAVLLVAVVTLGCSRAAVLQGRIDGLRDVVDQAERNGAYRCAPRELAMAQANLDFAQTELAQGDLDRAEEHFRLAEPNGRAAFRLSPAARCAPREVEVAQLPPQPGDADGDGILDPEDECPNDPEDFDAYQDEDGCPEDQDADGDGLPDTTDACPVEPEDADGYQDGDGCPEPDNDLDTLVDQADRCPNEPEDVDGHSDSDGCPDLDNDGDNIPDASDDCPNEPGPADEQGCPRVYQDVEVTSTGIVIHQRIYFEYDRARIRPRSYPILNTVAQVMRDFPDITVEIQGHTDSRGRDEYNMELSQERAEAVRSYLMQQGIAGERMTARGYGESRPIDSNRTAAGRAANRRVEFVRTDEAAEQSRREQAVP